MGAHGGSKGSMECVGFAVGREKVGKCYSNAIKIYSRLQPNSSIFGLTKYILQIVQYLIVFRMSVFGIR